MEVMRLVIAGTVGSGKTTFIRTISEIEVVDTDRTPTDEVAEFKKSTTVSMDFGRFTFDPAMTLHLYGTPGQSRFDFMWDLLVSKAHAYMLLVAAHRPEDFKQARQIFAFIQQRVDLPMILGVTHTDCENAWATQDVAFALGWTEENPAFPVVEVNATCKESAIAALIQLVERYTQFNHDRP